MTVKQQVSHSANDGPPGPPPMATKLLSFFLPATLREPILGDLEEEFCQRFDSASNSGGSSRPVSSQNYSIEAYRWYWWQVLHSACLFFWHQRGTVMAYLISVIFFGLMFALAVATGGYGLWYVMPTPLMATIPASLLLGIGATSIQAAKTAFKLSFSDADEHSPHSVGMARRFLRVTGNQFLLVAGVVFFMSSIQWLFMFSQNPELINDPSHYAALGFAILPLFYGMAFKCLFYSAEQKLTWKYAQE